MSDAVKQTFDFSLFWEYRGVLLQGLIFNALVFACAAALALSVGLGAALLRIGLVIRIDQLDLGAAESRQTR